MATLAFILLSILLFPTLVSSQTAFVYDGSSTVTFSGQYNWTIKYPLGGICEDLNWGKVLTIDITSGTRQADLIFAFGTQSQYFAVVIAYDGAVWVPLSPNNDRNVLNEPSRIGAVFVTPPNGSPLQESLISLEQQYARSIDFRSSLITGLNQTKEWEMIADDNGKTNPFGQNGTQLVLDIRGDRRNGLTYLEILKNGRNGSIEMSSTWGYGDNVFLYMGLDGIHDEHFVLSGITSDDQCSWTPRPTTAIPTMDTLQPTMTPSISPTDDTKAPSMDPSMDPTSDPTTDPIYEPTMDPSTDPTSDPTMDPTELPTEYPTMEPTLTLETTYTSDEEDISSTMVIIKDRDTTSSTDSSASTTEVKGTEISDGNPTSCLMGLVFGAIVILYTLDH